MLDAAVGNYGLIEQLYLVHFGLFHSLVKSMLMSLFTYLFIV